MDPLSQNARIAVVGAGAMGAGIAQVAAQAGHPVLLLDNRPGAAAQAIAAIDQRLGQRVLKGKLEQSALEAIRQRLQPAQNLEQLADSDLIIEAIAEQLPAKQQLFAELEALCRADCILASNTSSLSITAMAAGLRHPQRLLGLHFFNPAPVMALVEVVHGLASDPALAQCLCRTMSRWGKHPVHTRSTPGFIVNRVARPFYGESLRLLQEGAGDCATLDALLREAGGFAMGAFELTDLIGQDINYAVTCSVHAAYYGDPRFQPSLIQKELVDAGYLGRKTGRGFYAYAEDAPRPAAARLSSDSAVEHCVLEGDLGWAAPLVQRLEAHGVQVIRCDGRGLLRVGEAILMPSDGRLAGQRARDEGLGNNLVLLDLALDYRQASRLAISCSSAIAPQALDRGGCPAAAGWTAGQSAQRYPGPGGIAHRGHARQRGRRCRAAGRGLGRGHRSGHAQRRQLPPGAPGLGRPTGPGAAAQGAGKPPGRLWRGTLPAVPAVAPPCSSREGLS